MIIGIGIDLIEVARVSKVCTTNARFVERIFAESEIEYSFKNKVNPHLHLAACWAAKEAFYKATNIRCSFRDVVVAHEVSGKPYFTFGESAERGLRELADGLGGAKDTEVKAHLSISHIKEYATAMVVVER